MNDPALLDSTLANLPPVWPEEVLPSIRELLAKSSSKVVILDDDSTGTQAVAGIPAVTHWDEATLRAEFARESPGFFILTNSRSLSTKETFTLHRTIALNLRTAANGRSFTVISRGDSTLRGHFPTETDALSEVLGPFDLTVVVPFFEAAGHLTVRNQHYIVENDRLVPVAQTAFAADGDFGYSTSDLPAWIAEKTNGWVYASDVVCIPLEMLRSGGPDRVAEALLEAPAGKMCVVNAVAKRDIEVLVAAALAVEARGRRLLFRTGASLVSARLGQAPTSLVSASQLIRESKIGSLVVASAHLSNTSMTPLKLAKLQEKHSAVALALDAGDLLDPEQEKTHLANVAAKMNHALEQGQDVLLFTNPAAQGSGEKDHPSKVSHQLTRALIEVVQKLEVEPRFLIAKGGLTAGEIATESLGVNRVMVVGQLVPGVPVWRLGPEARFPEMPYVVFPGNVGSADALADALSQLKRPTQSAT